MGDSTASVAIAEHVRSLAGGPDFTIAEIRAALPAATKSAVVATLWRLKRLGAIRDVGVTEPSKAGHRGRTIMRVEDLDSFASVGGRVVSTRVSGSKAHRGRRSGSKRARDLDGIRQVLAKTTAGDGATWHLTHAATTDGLSEIDDGREHGMFPVRGEAYDVELAQRCVNYVVTHVLGRVQS